MNKLGDQSIDRILSCEALVELRFLTIIFSNFILFQTVISSVAVYLDRLHLLYLLRCLSTARLCLLFCL